MAELAELTAADVDPLGDRQPELLAPINDPSGPWEQQVHDIVQEIERGAVQKVVLARELHLRARADFDIALALRRLAATAGHCTLFALDTGSGCMIGATPERLVRLQGKTVQVDCLAGSTARGDTEHADRRLGEALLQSAKDRREHGLVVRTLREALSIHCLSMEVPEAPRLLRLPDVQHLHTPLQGTLPVGFNILGAYPALRRSSSSASRNLSPGVGMPGRLAGSTRAAAASSWLASGRLWLTAAMPGSTPVAVS